MSTKTSRGVQLGLIAEHAVALWECRYDGVPANRHPVDVPGSFHCITPVPRPTQPRAVIGELAAQSSEGDPR